MTEGDVRFDPKALRIQMEGMFVKQMMGLSNMSPEERKNMETLTRVFGKHGIGVLEAIDIITELTAALNPDTK